MKEEQRVAQRREILRPSAVRLHHVPNWLRLQILKAYGCRDGWTNGENVLQAAAGHGGWLDHWGSTAYRNNLAFVSEPYGLHLRQVEAINEFTSRLDVEWWISANSWWNPGSTLRVFIVMKEQE